MLDNVEAHPNDVATLAVRRFGVTRQAVNKLIKGLADDGLLITEGQTQGITYRRSDYQRKWTLAVRGLSEHEVWNDNLRPMLTGLTENVVNILEYGFTEMLNNVIDHSESETVAIQARRAAEKIVIDIWDVGIGIFNKIQRDCALEDARHAVFELTKGKLTTDPARHTGEGVFFTSRMFDVFSIQSGGLFLAHHREDADGDWLLGNKDERKPGTLVILELSPSSTHTTAEVFDRYSTEQDDYAFSKTHVVVKLADVSNRFVSRSQAKRIVARLERFREVVLDFSGVLEVGPAFTDEIFRVFSKQHPRTHLMTVNANEQVTRMVHRAEAHGRLGLGDSSTQTEPPPLEDETKQG